MKEFNNIQTHLPYEESDAYVSSLVNRCKAEALKEERPAQRRYNHWLYSFAGATVAAAAAIVIGFFVFSPKHSPLENYYESPMDSFLASISDSEAAQIVDFPIDDIPEFYR